MASQAPDELTPPEGEPPPGDPGEFAPDLTRRQEQGLLALLNESTVLGASNASGIPERTLHNWLRLPHFKKELRRLRREAFAQAVALAQRYAPMATTTLAQIAHDKAAPHSAKVAASQALLKFGRESIELDDLAARVDGLEEQQKQREDKR